MRVIVTGSRAWRDDQTLYDALWAVYKAHGAFEVIHGDCSTGADAMANFWYRVVGRNLGCTEMKYPAAWAARGGDAGPERNRRMVEAGADLVLAFDLPGDPEGESATRLAEAAGIEVKRFEHE